MSERYYRIDKSFAKRTDLNPTDKLVFGIVRDHIGHNSDGWPGYGKMAEEAGLERKAIIRSVKKLVIAGLLTVIHGGRQAGRFVTNRYRLGNGIPSTDVGLGPNRDYAQKGTRDSPDVVLDLVPDGDCNYPNGTTPVKLPKKKAAVKKPTAAFTQFTDYFVEEWKKHAGKKYPWQKAKDGKGASTVWNACDKDLPLAKKVVDAYFTERADFYVGHPMALLGSQIAKFMVKASDPGTQDDEAFKAAMERNRIWMEEHGGQDDRLRA